MGLTGRELMLARKQAGLTQGQLAEAIGVSERSIRGWELRADEPVPAWRQEALYAALPGPAGLDAQSVLDRIVRAADGSVASPVTLEQVDALIARMEALTEQLRALRNGLH